MDKKVTIIGSGIAGLAAAIRLSAAGHKVDVYEKNERPGGKITAFTKDGFHFDEGPSVFTQPENIRELFSLCNENASDHIEFIRLKNTCSYFFNNRKVVNAWSDIGEFRQELINIGEKGDVGKYLARCTQLYNSIARIFLDHSLHKRTTWLNRETFSVLKHFRFSYLFKTLHKYNSRYFTTSEARRIFDRFATYNGSDPYKAPAMLSVIPHLEFNQGVYFPVGGMISVTNALYELAKRMGVKFHFGKNVQHIIQNEGKAMGIVCEGKNILSEIVISNTDIYFTYKNLLNQPVKARQIEAHERSSSAIIFYWTVTKEFSQTGYHNIFFSDQYEDEFKFLFNKKAAIEDPTIYLNITSKLDKDHAPSNMENWFVMVNVPSDRGQDWKLIRQKIRASVICKLENILGEEVEKYITSEALLDPLMIQERTGSYRGSLYGASSNHRKSAFLRHPNFSRSIKNLYFCGGSVHPGGGIPLCLRSAKIATDLILNDQKRTSH